MIVEKIALLHATFFIKLVNTHDWIRYIGNRNVSNADEANRFLENGFLKSYRDHGFGYYLIRTLEGTPIGITGFLKKPNLENPDFGFALLPEYYDQGLAFEASSAVLKYGIEKFRFTKLDAVVAEDNIRSIRLLEKLGFHKHSLVDTDTQSNKLMLYQWQHTK